MGVRCAVCSVRCAVFGDDVHIYNISGLFAVTAVFVGSVVVSVDVAVSVSVRSGFDVVQDASECLAHVYCLS